MKRSIVKAWACILFTVLATASLGCSYTTTIPRAKTGVEIEAAKPTSDKAKEESEPGVEE